MATDHDTVSPIEHDETANLRLALMERWRESCGRVAERFGRRSDIPFYSSALSALAGECADDMGKSGRVAEAAVAMLADALMEKDPRGYADSAEAAARELERLVSSIAYADALGRLRAANSTFETRILGEIDGTDPDALPAVPDGLVGPSDTATCTIDILGGVAGGQPRGAGHLRRHDDERGSRYRRLLLHHVHAARRLAQDGYLLQDMRLPPRAGRLGAGLFRLHERQPHRVGRIGMAIGRLLRGETAARAVPPRMPSPLGSQGGIQGGRRRGYRARGARYRAGGRSGTWADAAGSTPRSSP